MYYKMEINCCSDYLIYDDGRVFSKKRNKFLKPHTNKKGYMSLSLSINGKLKTRRYNTLAYEIIHESIAMMNYMLNYYLKNYAK